jgi:hypothetical protein
LEEALDLTSDRILNDDEIKPHTVQPHDHHYIYRVTTILTVPSMMTAGGDGCGKMESNNMDTHGSYTTYHTCMFY